MDEDLKRIAGRIRRWRVEADLTLQKLGDLSGVSASTIHKIENQQTVPTIAILLKVASGLKRRPSELLADDNPRERFAISRAAGRSRISLNENTTLEHLIAKIPNSRLDAWRIQIKAGTGVLDSPQEVLGSDAEIFLLIEDGCLEGEIGSESFKVEAGDSMHFVSSLPHRWMAGGDRPVTLLLIAIMPARLQGDLMSRISTAANTLSPFISVADN